MYRFTEDCLIGVEEIDKDHQELFRIINEVGELIANDIREDKYDAIRKLLRELQDYSEYHFRHEEEYMQKIAHPELELQKKQHAEFTAKMNELDAIADFRQQHELLDELMQYLVTWLFRHIIGSDMMIGKMPPLQEWEEKAEYTYNEQYSTGITFIDDEHKELFRIIGEVHRVIVHDYVHDKYDEIVRLLEELKNYTKFHFGDEEEYMAAIHYEGLEAQKKAHDAFVSRLEEMDLEYVDDNQQKTLEELLEFLVGWLVNHILHMDKKIGN